MNYKIFIILIFILNSCTQTQYKKNNLEVFDIKFTNKGFAMVYDEDSKNAVSKKLDLKSMTIFQRNLKKGSFVKITNLINGKTIVANVGESAKYPYFYNAVLSKRISTEIDLDLSQPYIEIQKISNDSSFIAKKAKTFEEEKKVANKAPVEGIIVDDLSKKQNKTVKKTNKKKLSNSFYYIIKIADFYFESSANMMKKRIIKETKIKKVNIVKLSSNNYRVYTGPYKNINDLKNSYNIVSQLEFENIEFIKK